MTTKDRIDRLTRTLLDPQASGDDLFEATRELNATLQRLAPVKPEEGPEAAASGSRLDQGEAVSPACAAECGLQPLRVARFLQGVERAIETARRRFAPSPVHLLYAGTGPYATLITPLLGRYTPEQLQVTLLDYHRLSLDSVRGVIAALGLEGFVKGYVEADASRYRHPPEDPIHVVVSETMAAALENEMQVAITLNLAPQLAEGGVWVPERIRLAAVLARPEEILVAVDHHAPPPYPRLHYTQSLGTLFEIGAEEALRLAANPGDQLPAGQVAIPEIPRGSGLELFLITEITVNGGIVLNDRDCTLNHPRLLPGGIPGEVARFAYRLGSRPGLEAVAGG